jgi:hypothetical protein
MTEVAPARARSPETSAAFWPFGDYAQARKRTANDYIREALHLVEPKKPIAFFCECDRSDCFAPVWLQGQAYDELRGQPGGRVLAAEHSRA